MPGGDEVARGLGAGVLQQHEEHRELHLVEPVAVDLGVQQHRHEVVARVVGTLGAHRVGVRVHRLRRFAALLGGGVGVEAEGELGPLEDLLAVLLGYARRGRRSRAAAATARRRCTRSHSPRSATESITESTRAFTCAARSLMRRGVKPRRDELAQLGVVGRVEADHQQRRAARRRRARRRRAGTGWARCGSRSSRARRAARRRGVSPPSSRRPRPGGPGARPDRGRAGPGTPRTGSRARRSRIVERRTAVGARAHARALPLFGRRLPTSHHRVITCRHVLLTLLAPCCCTVRIRPIPLLLALVAARSSTVLAGRAARTPRPTEGPRAADGAASAGESPPVT